MIVTIKAELTWSGMNKEFFRQSEKKLKKVLKDMTGAEDVEILDVDAWDEDGEQGEE